MECLLLVINMLSGCICQLILYRHIVLCLFVFTIHYNPGGFLRPRQHHSITLLLLKPLNLNMENLNKDVHLGSCKTQQKKVTGLGRFTLMHVWGCGQIWSSWDNERPCWLPMWIVVFTTSGVNWNLFIHSLVTALSWFVAVV